MYLDAIIKNQIIQKRLEFFKTYTDELHENQLLQTIRIPKNLLFLTDKLPQATYEKYNKKNLKNLPDINLKMKKKENKGNFDLSTQDKIEKKSSIHDIIKSTIEEEERKKKKKEEDEKKKEIDYSISTNKNHEDRSNNQLNINSSRKHNLKDVNNSKKPIKNHNVNSHQLEIVLPNLNVKPKNNYYIKYDKGSSDSKYNLLNKIGII